jgi:hypothetical protein
LDQRKCFTCLGINDQQWELNVIRMVPPLPVFIRSNVDDRMKVFPKLRRNCSRSILLDLPPRHQHLYQLRQMEDRLRVSLQLLKHWRSPSIQIRMVKVSNIIQIHQCPSLITISTRLNLRLRLNLISIQIIICTVHRLSRLSTRINLGNLFSI